MSSISTSPDYTAVVSVEDLLDSKLFVYGAEGFRALIGKSELLERYRSDTGRECRDHLSKGEHVICLVVCKSLVAGQYALPDVFVSNSRFVVRPESFVTAVDWPLYSKVNKILLMMNDGGLNALFREHGNLLFSGSCIIALCFFFLEILIFKFKQILQFHKPFICLKK